MNTTTNPRLAKIFDCLDHEYNGMHKVIGRNITRSIRDLLQQAIESDHWHDLDDEKRETVQQLLDFHADYTWSKAV